MEDGDKEEIDGSVAPQKRQLTRQGLPQREESGPRVILQRWEMLLAQCVGGAVVRTDVFFPGRPPYTLGSLDHPTLLLEQGWEPAGLNTIPSDGSPLGLIMLLFKRRIPLGDRPELDAKPQTQAWFATKLKKEHLK